MPIENAEGFRSAKFGTEPVKLAGLVPMGTAIPKALPSQPNADDLAEAIGRIERFLSNYRKRHSV